MDWEIMKVNRSSSPLFIRSAGNSGARLSKRAFSSLGLKSFKVVLLKSGDYFSFRDFDSVVDDPSFCIDLDFSSCNGAYIPLGFAIKSQEFQFIDNRWVFIKNT